MDENMENQIPPQDNQPPENEPQTPPQPEPQPTPEPVPTPPAASDEINKDSKMWGMFCHLSALAMFTSVPFANIIGPLILWLIKKDDFTFVDDQGKEALNFQISMSIYGLVSAVTLCFPPLFVIILVGLMITNLIFIIIAAIAANNGQAYRYPLSLRLVK